MYTPVRIPFGLIKLDTWVQLETTQGIFTGCVSKETISVKFREVKKENIIKKCDKMHFIDSGSPIIISLVDDKAKKKIYVCLSSPDRP